MFTVELKISFDHCAGRRSSNARAFSSDATSSPAISSTTAYGVSPYGPSHVSVSRMYSTWSSACRVPLMKVTAETSCHGPWRRAISSAPRPFCTVITVAAGQ